MQAPTEPTPSPRISVIRIGTIGGLVGMMCCVGPTVLALLGIIGAATADSWAENLYGRYAWWFRGAALLLMAGLVMASLRGQRRCSLRGVRGARRALLRLVVVAVATYATLYGVTTGLSQLAHGR
jgi:heme exporter protein D